MKILTKPFLFHLLFGGAGLIIGFFLSDAIKNQLGNKAEIRSEFFDRHEYRQRRLKELRASVEPLADRLNVFARDSSLKSSSDSAKFLISESVILLIKCDGIAYEIGELDKADSLLFEAYSK
jgi:hypothetical protein